MVKQLLTLLLVFSMMPASWAQDSMWQTLYEQGNKAFFSGKFVEAEKLFSSALKAVDAGADSASQDGTRLIIFEPLASALEQQGKYAESEAVYRREMAVCEKKFGTESPTVGSIYSNLGRLYSHQHKYAEADSFFKRALAIIEKASGKDSVESAKIVTLMADSKGREEKYAEADALYAQGQAVFEKKLGAEDLLVLQTLTHRAFLAVDQHKSAEAEKLLKRVLTISEKKFGADDLQTALNLDALSTVYITQGKYAEAEPLSKRSLAILEKVGGADSIFCLISLNTLVMVNSNARKFDEAVALNKRIIAIADKNYGPQHPTSVGAVKSLAWLLHNQKQYPQAQLLLERALEIQEKSPETTKGSLSSTMYNLATCYEDQQNYIDAEATYRKLLATDRERLGEADAGIASDLDCLARVLAAVGKTDEAAKLTRQSLTIKKTLPGSSKLNETAAPVQIGSPSNIASPSKTASAEKIAAPVKIGSAATDSNRPVKDKWALVVGISNFQDPSLNLQYAAKDATDFRNYLVNEGHFQSDHVKLLTDDQATRENIVGSLGEKWLGRLANPDDLVVLYVSSHGSAPADDAKGTNFIIPYETNMENLVLTGIPMQWFTAGVSKMVHCNRMVLVLDVCHAGAVGAKEKGLTRQPMFQVDATTLGQGQVLLASSDAEQTSYESKNYKNGVFTYQLLEGLRKHGDKTSLSDACSYLREKVQEEVLRDRAKLQTPVVVNNWQGGDVILGVIPAAPRPGLASSVKVKSP